MCDCSYVLILVSELCVCVCDYQRIQRSWKRGVSAASESTPTRTEHCKRNCTVHIHPKPYGYWSDRKSCMDLRWRQHKANSYPDLTLSLILT